MENNPTIKELVKKSLEIAENMEPVKFEQVVRPAEQHPLNLPSGHQVIE